MYIRILACILVYIEKGERIALRYRRSYHPLTKWLPLARIHFVHPRVLVVGEICESAKETLDARRCCCRENKNDDDLTRSYIYTARERQNEGTRERERRFLTTFLCCRIYRRRPLDSSLYASFLLRYEQRLLICNASLVEQRKGGAEEEEEEEREGRTDGGTDGRTDGRKK